MPPQHLLDRGEHVVVPGPEFPPFQRKPHHWRHDRGRTGLTHQGERNRGTAMDEFSAEFDRQREPGFVVRPHAPADAIPRFEHEHRPTRAPEFRRGGKSSRAGADYYNILDQAAKPDNGW